MHWVLPRWRFGGRILSIPAPRGRRIDIDDYILNGLGRRRRGETGTQAEDSAGEQPGSGAANPAGAGARPNGFVESFIGESAASVTRAAQLPRRVLGQQGLQDGFAGNGMTHRPFEQRVELPRSLSTAVQAYRLLEDWGMSVRCSMQVAP
jgi:hypothetical protein